MQQNCWQVKECGMRVRAKCPAYLEERLDGFNGGTNGGRACWVVEGTLCEGETQGTFAQKLTVCGACVFVTQVRREEGDEFVPSKNLLALLRE